MKWTEAELQKLPQISMWVPALPSPHPTVRLNGIDIDEELAPLLRAFWEQGIGTVACCQGRPFEYHISQGAHGHAYVLFKGFDQAVEFVRAVAPSITHEQGVYKIKLAPMVDGRASVSFPPLLIEPILHAWQRVTK